jgi:hypothetical protein
MFEPISRSLSQLASFAVLGFFFGIFYEAVRIIRLFKKQSDLAVSITDFLFLSAAGLVTFAYSMELGNGHFRWFYVAGIVFGGTVYFLTVGRLVSLASNLIVRCVKTFLGLARRYVFAPLYKKLCKFIQFLKSKIGNIYVFLRKKALNSTNHLKNRIKVVYNKRTIKTTVAGEKRNVIKGNIRKSGNSRNTTTATLRKT